MQVSTIRRNKLLKILFGSIALLCAFLVGLRWPRPVPDLIISEAPVRSSLTIKASTTELHASTTSDTLLSINDHVAGPEEELTYALDAKPIQVHWWSEDWKTEISLEGIEQILTKASLPTPGAADDHLFVASTGGTKYHPATGCHFADRIKEENRIYFDTEAEAQAAGYEPSTCFK